MIKILDVEIHDEQNEWWFVTPNGNRYSKDTKGKSNTEMMQTAKLTIMKDLGYSVEDMMKNYNCIN